MRELEGQTYRNFNLEPEDGVDMYLRPRIFLKLIKPEQIPIVHFPCFHLHTCGFQPSQILSRWSGPILPIDQESNKAAGPCLPRRPALNPGQKWLRAQPSISEIGGIREVLGTSQKIAFLGYEIFLSWSERFPSTSGDFRELLKIFRLIIVSN